MTTCTNNSCDYENCPVIFSLNLFSKKWLIPIMCSLYYNSVMRFGELSRSLDGITDMMLTQCLKELQRFGIVNRVQYNEMPLRVEYSLTAMGMDIVPSILSISKWSPQILNRPTDVLTCPHIACAAKVEHTVQLRQEDITNVRRNWDTAYEEIDRRLSEDAAYTDLSPIDKLVIVAEYVLSESTKAGEEMSRLATLYYIVGTEKSSELLSENRVIFRILNYYLDEARALDMLTDEMTNDEIIHATISFIHGLNAYWELERGIYDIVEHNHKAIVHFFHGFARSAQS